MSATECFGDVSERLEAIHNQRMETIKNIQRLKSEYEHVTRLLEEAGVSPEGELDARRNLGKRKFCTNPKLGLEFLFENNIIERSPEAVAKFFVDEKRNLSKAAIGSYLGEISKEFNMKVLEEYLKLHEFRNQDFLPALRNFLFDFQLPGESQKIDKILLLFAHEYVEQNPSAFHTSQDAYVLAYAAILLNTTLHNTNAKNQNLSLADEKTFIQTMLDFDKETNLSEDMIRSVYQGIKSKPIQLAEECSEPSIMRGWLWKLGGRVKIWKRRWFVLTDEYLYYYNAPERTTQRKGMVALENVCVRRVTSERSREFCFELYPRPSMALAAGGLNTASSVSSGAPCSSGGGLGSAAGNSSSSSFGTISTRKADRDGVVTSDHHATYRMAAANSEEYERWVTSLQLITNRFGLAAATNHLSAASASLGDPRASVERGSSVPCLPASSNGVDVSDNGVTGTE